MKPPSLLVSSLKGRAKYARLNSTSEKTAAYNYVEIWPERERFSSITKIMHLVILDL